ncbi:MAG TPA: CRISPR-associated helicase Cas3' [Gammaproteobacteria bacterium]|nr:CRISPR-associated helicase Cas3' [Gammaproteobacteria bacterium]
MTVTDRSYFSYWGKAGKEDDFHLLPFHSLDVAAVAHVLLAERGDWRSYMASLLRWPVDEVENWLPFLIALHDLGKFASPFQSLRPDIARFLKHELQVRECPVRHDTLGFMLWEFALHKSLFDQESVPSLPPPARRSPAAISYLMRAVTGHHGKPPKEAAQKYLRPEWFDESDMGAAQAFVKDAANLLLPPDCEWPSSSSEHLKTASWWLAGFTVLCDWVGSNRRYFAYHQEPIPLSTYWHGAKCVAAAAVAECGLKQVALSNDLSLRDCFATCPADLEPTPLQAVAASCTLGKGPQLFILEDVTGAGKTEAALVLAHRMMRQGLASSLYFALPTMATANAMYDRIGGVYGRMFAEDGRASLVLAHGQAGQMSRFRDSVLPIAGEETGEYGDKTLSATAACTAWLADNRKKALLANVGVGTIDQAMLAVLHAKHQSLRLLGLLDKLLIVDEVHACDAYMLRLLESLLRAHARSGGSAILLSATLAVNQREKLMTAFREGRGAAGLLAADASYPALSHCSDTVCGSQPVDAAPDSRRTVAAHCTDDIDSVYRTLAEAATKGGCACWIRNTVDDAREASETLRSRYPDVTVHLFHARYCLRDRLEIERCALERFGALSGPEQRAGQILIATQVVEQSLDVDFDVLASDLAPIDRLIQRAGRLHRHARAIDGSRIDACDQRGEPVLHVYAPAWKDRPGRDWLQADLPGTAAVYRGMDAHLWLTQMLLREHGGFQTPGDVRRMVEGVYGDDANEMVPEGLQPAWQAWQGENLADASVGSLNSIHIEGGYISEGVWTEDIVTPTRLGEPSVTIVLGRRDGGRIAFWVETGNWALSSLQILAKYAREPVQPADVSDQAWQDWLNELPAQGRWCIPVVLSRQNDGWAGRVKSADDTIRTVQYTAETGLSVDRDRLRPKNPPPRGGREE